MYGAHRTHGAGTWPHRTQLKTAARKTTLNTGQCVRQPREGRGRNRQATPPKKKKKEGGRGKRHENSPQPPNHPPTPPKAARPPPQEKKKKKKRGGDPRRGTGEPPTQNRQHQASNSGPRGKGTEKKKKKESHQPSPKERGWRDRDHKAQKKKKKEKKKPKQKKKKNTPRQPSQDGLGTGETRAQHTRPHRAPEPETAGGKRGAHETTHVPKAGRNRSPTTNTTNSRH